jgi:pimeloyl-ACP methyl ester carboxylesterase
VRPDAPSLEESVPVATPRGAVGVVDERSGSGGPTVVLVHGLPGSIRDWRWLAPALLEQGVGRVVRMDLPGFGKTDASLCGYDIDARGAFVAELIEAMGLEDVVLAGHSMGGPVAVSAARASDRVRAVALVASVGPRIHRGLRRVPGIRAGCYTLHVPSVARAALPRLRRFFTAAGFRNVSDDAILQTCFILARVRFATHRRNLAALRKPTLVAWALDDRIVEPAIGDALYWAAPVGPRVRFPTGGHNIQATRAVELAQAIATWADSL